MLVSTLKTKVDQFRSDFEAPRLFLADVIDKLKFQIDLETEQCLMRLSNVCKEEEFSSKQDIVNQNRRFMISQIDRFETDCFQHLPTNEIEITTSEVLDSSVNSFYLEILKIVTIYCQRGTV